MKNIPMQAVNQLVEQEARSRFKSPLLFGVLQALNPETRSEILDLTPANADSLAFFSQYRCKLYLPGCRDELLMQADIEDSADLPQPSVFARCLPCLTNAATALDLILLWDLPNYLNKRLLSELIDFLRPYITPRTVLHIYIHTRQTMPNKPGDYRLLSEQLVQADIAPSWNASSPMYYQELIHKVFAPFRVDRGMLLGNGLQEYILRATGANTSR
jgi:hypothetical protein